MLAHELRNPLAAIGNAVRLTPRTDAKEHIDWSMEVIARQMRHLSRLIDDLLDVSRITRGQDRAPTRRDGRDPDPRERRGHGPAARRGAEAHARARHRPRAASGSNVDPTRLEQVVVNLLNNAAKYSENGGHIRLSARAEGGRGRHPRQGPGRRHPAREAARDVRALRPGGPLARPLRGGPRDRPDRRQEAGRDARRARSRPRATGRARGSEFIIRLPAATSRPGAPRAGDGPRSDGRQPTGAGSSSSTTTWTRPAGWPGS